jgi:hypothetical protein
MSFRRIFLLVLAIAFAVSLTATAKEGDSARQPDKTPGIAAKPARITIASPQGGQMLRCGETAAITWNYSGDPGGPLYIRLIHHAGDPAGHGLFDVLISSQAPAGSGGHGSLSWVVPDVPTGFAYTVDIGAPNTGAASQKFTIVNPQQQPTLKITSPNGGEVWQKGKTYTITWSHVADPTQKVIITLLNGLDVSHFRTLGEAPAGANGTGSFSWTVPGDVELSKDYKIWLANGAYNKKFIDSSDNSFTITAPPALKPGNITKTPASPQPGDRDKLDPQPEPPK